MKAVEDFFLGEWYFAVPLVIMSLVSAALVLWRLLLNNTAKTDLDDFLPDFQETLRKRGIPGAIELCREEKGLIPSRLFVAGLEAADQGAAAMRRSMAAETELEIVPRLNALLPLILAIAKIATMVGLFFTVVSMINTFNAIGEAANRGGARDVGGHSSKIGLALFATALGLFTAIPLVFSHVLFKAWIAAFELKVKAAGAKLVMLVTNYKKDPNLLAPPRRKEDDEEADARRPARPAAREGRRG
ncbi:MAG TPA: MotA/TolQ/ExbB proton channel family protein [Urbifossiella sp.]|jgi:biopolymer transport protein ExbB|nr:MotA/TolQ/ExbB proton channel family protein [Urbifossiella sp.]